MLKYLVFLLAGLTLASQPFAQTSAPSTASPSAAAGPFPIKDYMRYPDFASPVLSPNGQYLAVLVPVKDKLNLAVIDLNVRKINVLTRIADFDVFVPTWVGNDRLVFTTGRRNSPTGPDREDGGGLFMVSRDGQESRVLSPTSRELKARGQIAGRGMRLVASIPDSDTEVLVSGNLRSSDSSDIYILNVTNGKTTLVSKDRPARVSNFVLDRNRIPRVAVSSTKDELDSIVSFRSSESEPWIELLRLKFQTSDQAEIFVPLAFDDDNKTLLVASNHQRDTVGIFRYDPVGRKFGELVAGHARFDMGSDGTLENLPGLLIRSKDRAVIGYAVEAERYKESYTEEFPAKIKAMVDAALPNRVNRLQFTNSDKVLVSSSSDRTSTEFLILDSGKKTLEPVANSMSWITDKHLVDVRPFVLKTRDGLEIPSYYLLPSDYRPGEKRPTVVHIHGGPFARADRWGALWEGGFGIAEAQLLASRGYVVIVPNFRITTGLGTKIYAAGFNAYGRQMSEDHEDAAKWAVDQGYADPARLCISGASYGGYASLWAMVKTADLFKCAVAGLPPTDLELQLTSTAGDTAYSTASQKYWREVIGDTKVPGTSKTVSPALFPEKVKGAVLLYAGADDIRVPLEQTTKMVNALKRVGHPPEDVIIKAEEGHSYGVLDNRLDLYERVLAFLDKHIGKGYRAN